MKDLHSKIKPVTTLLPQVVTANKSGTGVDIQGYGSVEHLVHIGASGDTLAVGLKFDFSIEESDDNATWNAVTSSNDVLGLTPDAGGIWATIDAPSKASQLYRIGYRGNKRYSRISVTKTGTHTNGTPIAISAIMGHPQLAPTS